MKKVDTKYSISFGGLKDGEHDFQFEFDKQFFEEFNIILGSEYGNLLAAIKLVKGPRLLNFFVNIRGTIHIQCDRCLEYFDLPINFNGELYVKFQQEKNNTDQDIIYLDSNETSINLKQYLFESIRISIPIQKIHPDAKDGESGCNEEMIHKLNEYLISDKKTIDPRWDKLKDYKI